MQAVIYTQARNKLNKIIDNVVNNSEPAIIVGSKGREDAVIISKKDYDNLIENLYVLSNPEWRKSIERGLNDTRKGKKKKLSIKQALGI